MKIHSLLLGLFLASVSVSAFSQDEQIGDCESRDKLAPAIVGSYSDFYCFIDGMAIVSKDRNTFGYADTTGKLAIPLKYTASSKNFKNGLALVQKSADNGYQFIDKTGKTVLDLPQYDWVLEFENGLAKVSKTKATNKLENTVGYIDEMGKVVIPPEYVDVSNFHAGTAYAMKYLPNKGLRFGVINLKNETLIPFEYINITGFRDGITVAGKHCEKPTDSTCRYGVINQQNQTIVPFEYQQIGEFNNGIAIALKNNLLGKIDIKGKVIVPFTQANQKALEKEILSK